VALLLDAVDEIWWANWGGRPGEYGCEWITKYQIRKMLGILKIFEMMGGATIK
jgi:hypothetical protein